MQRRGGEVACIPGTEEVAGTVEGCDVITEDLEFSISQYVDGALSNEERTALELRLQLDAEARGVLGAYVQLSGVLKSSPLPNVRWDAFAKSISAAVESSHQETSSRVY